MIGDPNTPNVNDPLSGPLVNPVHPLYGHFHPSSGNGNSNIRRRKRKGKREKTRGRGTGKLASRADYANVVGVPLSDDDRTVIVGGFGEVDSATFDARHPELVKKSRQSLWQKIVAWILWK